MRSRCSADGEGRRSHVGTSLGSLCPAVWCSCRIEKKIIWISTITNFTGWKYTILIHQIRDILSEYIFPLSGPTLNVGILQAFSYRQNCRPIHRIPGQWTLPIPKAPDDCSSSHLSPRSSLPFPDGAAVGTRAAGRHRSRPPCLALIPARPAAPRLSRPRRP